MESTKDYQIFRDFASNREVDHKHVNKLVNAIRKRNLLHVNPIIVDDRMRVIDGQHRLAAAEILGVEIYYVKGEVNREDISVLNSNQKNWTVMDYINHYTVEKRDAFVQISGLINKHPRISVSALLALANSEGKRVTEQIRRGYLDVLNIGQAKDICFLCESLSEKYQKDFPLDSKFPLALSRAMALEGFNIDTLLKKIEESPRDFVPCHTVRQYLEMIEEIYNRGLSKNRIRIG